MKKNFLSDYSINRCNFLVEYSITKIFDSYSPTWEFVLTWKVNGSDSLFEQVFSGQSINCSVSHFRVGFKRDWEVCRLGKPCGEFNITRSRLL